MSDESHSCFAPGDRCDSIRAITLSRSIELGRNADLMTKPIKTASRMTSCCVAGSWLVLLLFGLLCGCAAYGGTGAGVPPAGVAPPPSAPPPPPTLGPPRDGGGPVGEGAPPPIPKDGGPAAADGGGVPHYHGYALFTELDSEPHGYGMYTYVLSSNLANATPTGTDDVQKRYDALLKAIGSSASSLAALSAAGMPAGETNLFCVPSKAGNASGAPALANYNSELAVRYRLLVEKQLASDAIHRSLENHSGPFLVSSLSRLTQSGPGAPILFADLSDTHPGAMQEVVNVYKQRVSAAPIEKAETFKPFKLALLNIILNGNDYVQIEKVAIAGMLPPAESHP